MAFGQQAERAARLHREPRFLPAGDEVMSAEIAAGDFSQ
jgi:hypothetical protein